jgi:flagellar biosynthesis/type III secretory pathway protein FliH
MSSIIRATLSGHRTPGVAFNFDDMAFQADQYLKKVRAEAAQIVAKAQQQADAVRQQARQEGHQAGWQAVEQIVRQQLATALPALKNAIQDIQHAKQAWLAHWEAGAVHVAAAIAQRLIRRELTRHPEITLTLVREALELAAGSSQVRIHLNPADHQQIGPQAEMLIKELSTLTTAELLPDPQITPGGCRVETRFGVIDQQFEAQLQRIEEELT